MVRSWSNVTRRILPPCSIHGMMGCIKTSPHGLANNIRNYYVNFVSTMPTYVDKVVFEKWTNPGLFFIYFWYFLANNTIITTNQSEKCPSSIGHQDLNPQPFDNEFKSIKQDRFNQTWIYFQFFYQKVLIIRNQGDRIFQKRQLSTNVQFRTTFNRTNQNNRKA